MKGWLAAVRHTAGGSAWVRGHGVAQFRLSAVPAQMLLGLIWLYRHTFSPALPAVFGPTCGCRFHPTCAVYTTEAVRTHGAVFGAWLGLRRLLKCHPFHPGGFDPVPPSPSLPLALFEPRRANRPTGPVHRRPACHAVFPPASKRR